jgi:hypothetical protein
MRLFELRRQAHPLGNDESISASPDRLPTPTPAADLLRHAFSSVMGSVEVRWRLLVETALIGCGALLLSALFIWATLTNRVSVEAIVVMIVMLVLSIFTVSHGIGYHSRNLLLLERARESAAKSTLAVQIMMDFLREFTLKNQAIISQMAEGHKVRVVDELRKAVADLGRSVVDGRLRLELAQFEETIARKITEIPVGVALPLPRLEYFDQALRHIQEPERTPPCPTCRATQTRVSELDGREGIHYTCTHCGHEFSVGITVMLEKHS